MVDIKSFDKKIKPDLAKEVQNWQEWLLSERRLSINTASNYFLDLKEFFFFLTDYLGKEITFKDLQKLSVTDFRSFLVAQSQKGIGRSSISRHLSTLRNFFKYLRRKKIVENTAISAVRSARQNKILPKPIQSEDTFRLLSAALKMQKQRWQGLRDVALLTMLYGCGLRISEARNLTVGDFQSSDDVIKIKGKGNKERFVPVLPLVKKTVADYLKDRGSVSSKDFLFIGARGDKLTARVVQRQMEKLRVELGLPASATPHALRHSFATDMLCAGTDLRSVQELLGHSSLSATQRYTEIDTVQLTKVYQQAHPRAKLKK